MALTANLKHFLDEEGKVLDLTDQAYTVFKFLTEIVSSVSAHTEQSLIDVNLQCSRRADALACEGNIAAVYIVNGMIEWHCDTCEAAGTISNWQGSLWDKQKYTLH